MLDTFIQKYLEAYSGYRDGKWCCQDGCVYKGTADLYAATRDQWYLDLLIQHTNKQIQPNGHINGYDPSIYNLNHLNSGKVLFLLYEKTNDVRYLIALRNLRKQIQTQPCTRSKIFWHDAARPWQVRLDGLYMGLPMLAKYSLVFENGNDLETVRQQIFNVRSIMFDSKKGLYHYAYDESYKAGWTDKSSGLSTTFWSQAMGWYFMALVDLCEIVGNQHQDFIFYSRLIEEFAENLLLRQQPIGLWPQVMDQPEREGNYFETSASVMFAYGFLKANRLYLLDHQYSQAARKAFDGIVKHHFKLKKDTWHLEGICTAAGLMDSNGDFEQFINFPIMSNHPKGVGPLFMLVAELLRQRPEDKNESRTQDQSNLFALG